MRKIEYGDVIFVERDCGIFGYRHFGIYSGNGKVIHYVKAKNSIDISDGVIMETSIKNFLNGDKCYICIFNENERQIDVPPVIESSNDGLTLFRFIHSVYKCLRDIDFKLYSPEETVRRAKSKIGERGYNLAVHNCEHFAMWCKTGVEKSEQIDTLIDNLLDVSGDLGFNKKVFLPVK